jgi:hypothetical protein
MRTNRTKWIAALLFGTVQASAGLRILGQTAVTKDPAVTVPMKLVNNRVFIPLKVTGPNGSRIVDFWVDSGGGTLALSGQLALELGLKPIKGSLVGFGDKPAQVVTSPHLSIGDLDLNLSGVSVGAHLAPPSKTVFAGIEAQGFLPAAILKNYDVVFDYLHGSFTLGKPGTIEHQGAAVPLSVQPKTGFARIELTINSRVYGFMLDTGAAFTGMSEDIFSQLEARNPAWPHAVGAVCSANMVGKKFDAENKLLVVPTAQLGEFTLHNIGMVSRPAGVYEKYISAEMSAPIVGALAGNVLRQFRIEFDYQQATAYLTFQKSDRTEDLNCVGLIVHVQDDGDILVSGTAQHDGVPEIPEVRAGDTLVAIDGQDVRGIPLSAILTALSGRIGEVKKLTIQRARQQIVVVARVREHPL